MSARTAVPRYRCPVGPAILQQGFRPFFLLAGLWAAAAVPLWLVVFHGGLAVPSAFGPAGWHGHEMIFGFAAAVLAGFLLTAIPNWTGRLPLQGRPLAGLVAVWLAGRLAVALSEALGPWATAAVDLAFLVLMLMMALREIVAGRNWRNLPLMGALLLLIAANVLTHLEVAGLAATMQAGERLGIAVFAMLIGLIGGRIIPSFTRNWLVKRGASALPAPFGAYDKACLLVSAAGLAGWVVAPALAATGGALLAAGALQLLRLARWQGRQTLAEPLMWSLHLGYLWLPLALMLLGLGILLPSLVPETAGLHALTAGAIGAMTLAVMTRATLGHTGRALKADGVTTAIYLAIAASAALRVAAALVPDAYLALLWAGGLLWTLAFGLFVLRYAPLHLAHAPVPG